MAITIGVDIGGSHVSSAGVNMETSEIVQGTFYQGPVNNKANKERIFNEWGKVINQTLHKIRNKDLLGIAFAMPGPFNYVTGTAMFNGNDKYEALKEVSVNSEFPNYLIKSLPLRYLNDATSFGVGAVAMKKDCKEQKVIAITLGTGFGAAFLNNNLPAVQGFNVPKEGCLWDKKFLNGIADDYFSTRWFLSKYNELTGKNSLTGVKDLVTLDNSITVEIFKEFANNLSLFLIPYFRDFKANTLVLGGNITKSHRLFLPILIQKLQEKEINISISIVEKTEEANIIGSSYIYNENFWEKIRKDLPNF